MKKILMVTLAALLLFSLAACGGEKEDETPKETTSVSQYKSKGDYQEIVEKLSWEKINSFPMKRADMTEEEMRKLVVDFFLFSKSFVWISDGEYQYAVTETSTPITLAEGGVYAGFPYISKGSNSVYRMMDYMDPETGVVNIKDAGKFSTLFGNQCSFTCYWAWARITNSITKAWTKDVVQGNGFLLVGDYTYPEDLVLFSNAYGTGDVVAENGADVMYEAYAKVKPGDGLVCNNPGNHLIMATGETHVERDANGKIDPHNSYVLMSDQTRNTGWVAYTNDSGDQYQRCGRVNYKKTFTSLFNEAFVPVTIKEYSGADPIEETEVSFSHTGETITRQQLFSAIASTNYSFTDLYAIFTDSQGNEVYRLARRITTPAYNRVQFIDPLVYPEEENYAEWGSMKNLSADEEYTVKIVAQLGTGERPTLWEGKFAQ